MKMYHISRLGPTFFVSASIFIGSFLIMRLAWRVGLGTTQKHIRSCVLHDTVVWHKRRGCWRAVQFSCGVM